MLFSTDDGSTNPQEVKRKPRFGGRLYRLLVALTAASLLVASVILARPLWAWGGKPHSFIIDAALTAIPDQDQIAIRLGGEVQHLRNTVQMGDWVNSLIVVNENWHVTLEDFPLVSSQYFGNDYLLFPEANHTYSHVMPQVAETYTPFFLRSLQALRTEDAINSTRWMGALLHFVTDSGSPPHTIPLLGPNHAKMENWLDASRIDLRGYQPMLLGRTDAEAVAGLQMRMTKLIARNRVIAMQMVPFAEADDRAHVEPLALDCATETARVAADVIHTLLVLSSTDNGEGTASLVVNVRAPSLQEHRQLPAKLVLMGTDYSTLSESFTGGPEEYSGSFIFTHLAPGHYRAAIERPGSQTLFPPEFVLEAGRRLVMNWKLLSAQGNLVQNSDFKLRWVRKDAPDHWHYDKNKKSWLSDNIPVVAGNHYLATIAASADLRSPIHLEWMAQHWKTTADPAIPLATSGPPNDVLAPPTAVYVRFVIEGEDSPSMMIRSLSFAPRAATSGAGAAEISSLQARIPRGSTY